MRRAWLAIALVVLLIGGAWFWRSVELKREQEQQAAAIAEKAKRAAELQRELEQAEARRTSEAKLALEKLYGRWHDADVLALSTPFLTLSGPVASLQALRREAADIDAPPCLLVARAKLVAGMTGTINGYLSAMGSLSRPSSGLLVHFAREKAHKDFAFFRSAMAGCQSST